MCCGRLLLMLKFLKIEPHFVKAIASYKQDVYTWIYLW